MGVYVASSAMRIGRWSELRVGRVCHWVERAMSGLLMEMSGEDGFVLVGARVGVSVLRVQKSDVEICVAMSSPLLSASDECQRGSCALKSPNMSVVCVLWRRGEMSAM